MSEFQTGRPHYLTFKFDMITSMKCLVRETVPGLTDSDGCMAVTQVDVARRLRAAREAAGLTQDEVARALGIARTAIVQLERGSRSVSAIELVNLAGLYGRDTHTFVDEESSSRSVDTLLRAFVSSSEAVPDEAIQASLRIGRELTNLERIVGIDRRVATSVNYSLAKPRSRYEAVQQGADVALQERHRLGIGDTPITDAGVFLEQQGVRTAELDLSSDISGLMIVDQEIGPFVVVNENEPPVKRQISYIHQYAQVIMSLGLREFISRYSKQDDLVEVRASAFASALLLPEGGVRRYLAMVGKEGTGRLIVESQFSDKPTVLEDRDAKARTIRMHDIVLLSKYFGVSRQIVLYRLKNLGFIRDGELSSLFELEQLGFADKIEGLFDTEEFKAPKSKERFVSRLLGLIFEAVARKAITAEKFKDLLQIASSARGATLAWDDTVSAMAATLDLDHI